ncbi:MAG: hypothetical protein WA208_04570 [Thermoanaerobaculia bacterium]
MNEQTDVHYRISGPNREFVFRGAPGPEIEAWAKERGLTLSTVEEADMMDEPHFTRAYAFGDFIALDCSPIETEEEQPEERS